MRILQGTSTVLIAGCAIAAGPVAAPAPQQAPFPSPTKGLAIEASGIEGGTTLAELLREFCSATGQNLSVSQSTRQQLEMTPVGLMNPVEVPEAEVYSFVEGLLRQHDYVLTVQRDVAPMLLGVYSRDDRQRRSIRDQGRGVAREELDQWAAHPAVMIRTVVDVAPANAHELGNNLRMLVSDQSLHGIWSSGSPASMIVEGPAAWVIDTTATIERVVANHVAWEEARRQQPETRGDAEGGRRDR
jgi:hypothetical protein